MKYINKKKLSLGLLFGVSIVTPTLLLTSCSLNQKQDNLENENSKLPESDNKEPNKEEQNQENNGSNETKPNQDDFKYTKFKYFEIENSNFTISEHNPIVLEKEKFTNFPAGNRDEIIKNKSITANFVFQNIDLFVEKNTHNIKENSIIMSDEIKYWREDQETKGFIFSFHFGIGSIYFNGELNKTQAPTFHSGENFYPYPIDIFVKCE